MADMDLAWIDEAGALHIRYRDGSMTSYPAPRFWRLRGWLRSIFRPAA